MSKSSFQVHYSKPRPIDIDNFGSTTDSTENLSSYRPFQIQDLQLYNPVYNRFFDMTHQNYDKIALNHQYHMVDPTHVFCSKTQSVIEKPVFIKFSPLLDPFRYMIGKYDVKDPKIRSLPKIDSTDETVLNKILSPHNASYVDCFFNYLTSGLLHHHDFVHGVDFYGSYLGIQKQFKVCATDDLDYLQNSNFFNKHHGNLFTIDHPNGMDNGLEEIAGSRRNRRRLCIGGTPSNKSVAHNVSAFSVCDLDIESIDLTASTDPVVEVDTVYAKDESLENPDDGSEPDPSNLDESGSGSDSDLNYSSEEDLGEDKIDDEENDQGSEWSTESEDEQDLDAQYAHEEQDDDQDDEDEEQEEIYGYIKDFPVQMICLEKCEGTLDQLFVRKVIDEDQAASVLFQVIMILLTYQKAFHFTHNDLHTNNIMWTRTDTEYLYYKFLGKVYKVPTYGRIYKIIDFGRSIYTFQKKMFCSDSFGPGGDAATQYNCEPFFNENKPRLEPNYAFDLCRLGSSIYDFIIDPDDDPRRYDEFQKTIVRWCTDDRGKNVLYKKNGEERYPNFKLYKMIARTVHDHTPEAQLSYPFFNRFLDSECESNFSGLIDLDTLPCYV